MFPKDYTYFERKINAIFEVTYMTDGSGVYHGEYKGLKPTVWAV